MPSLDREDRRKISHAVDNIVAISVLHRIRRLISRQAAEDTKGRRWAGALGGILIALLFGAIFLSMFYVGIQNRHLPPNSFADILPRLLPSALIAVVALSFAVHFLSGYRISMTKCLTTGFVFGVLVGILATFR